MVLHQGELAPPGFPIISLVNLDDVWAVFNLREDELAPVEPIPGDLDQLVRTAQDNRPELVAPGLEQ